MQTSSPHPTTTLLKGAGAIPGIGEKLAVDLITGTGMITVLIPTSPGRSWFGPRLNISYTSRAGIGQFGFG